MISELTRLLPEFQGAASRSRCFTHILNLAAKSVLRLFDLPKAKADEAMSEAARELMKLSEELELDELQSRVAELEEAGGLSEESDDDNDIEGWVDELAELSDDEREEREEESLAVRLMLVKVSHCSHITSSSY